MSSLTIAKTESLLDSLRSELTPILSENGQSFDRLRTVFMTAVQQNPDILKCSDNSIRREVSKCAADGLVPDGKEAAMIPYKGELQYQPMVHGIIKRLRELGGVFSITCKLVYEKDEFILNEADPDSLVHNSDPFSKDRGEIRGGYAIFRDEQKRVMHLETMSAEDFQRVRKASKSPDSPAWKNWQEEMCRKAVLRRGSKYLSINNDKIRTLLERTDELFDFQQPRSAERMNPFGGPVIDNQSTAPQISHQPGETMPLDTKAQAEPVRQQAKAEAKQPQQTAAKPAAETKPAQQQKKEEPAGPPKCPTDILIKSEDLARLTEGAEKILAIANETSLDAPDRRGVLKAAAENWSKAVPEYAKPLLRACIDMTDWAIKQAADGKPWASDHAMFVHHVKELLGVERLNVGKYPS